MYVQAFKVWTSWCKLQYLGLFQGQATSRDGQFPVLGVFHPLASTLFYEDIVACS